MFIIIDIIIFFIIINSRFNSIHIDFIAIIRRITFDTTLFIRAQRMGWTKPIKPIIFLLLLLFLSDISNSIDWLLI